MEVAFLAGAIGLFGAIVGTATVLSFKEFLWTRRKAFALWQRWATSRGLTYKRGRISGEIEGRPVTVRMNITPDSNTFQRLTTIGTRLARALPSGLRISPDPNAVFKLPTGDIQVGDRTIDSRCEIHARDPGLARAVLGDAEVRAALRPLLESGATIWLSGEELRSAHPGRITDPLDLRVTQTLALAAALEEAPERPFAGLAERRDWDATVLGGNLLVEGVEDGFAVSVRYHQDKGPMHTAVRVVVPGLDERLALHVTVPEFGGAQPSLALGDPIVDRLLYVHGNDADAVAALLRDDDLRAELLEVVHGHPGSAVRHGAVLLAVPGYDLSGVDHRLDLALALARSLRNGLLGSP